MKDIRTERKAGREMTEQLENENKKLKRVSTVAVTTSFVALVMQIIVLCVRFV